MNTYASVDAAVSGGDAGSLIGNSFTEDVNYGLLIRP
jgi:hypothetical protein